MNTDTFNLKRTIYLACLGVDIYILALYMTQSALVTGGQYMLDIFPELMSCTGMLNGIVAIASVTLGLILLWLYMHEMQAKGFLFAETRPISAIMERHGSFGIGKCLSFAFLMIAMQLISMLVLGITELILNSFGFTTAESPAMNADYTDSILLMLYVVLIGPLIEELVFRGFLLRVLSGCGKVYAIVISALMFSLMHGDIQQLFFTFVAGLILGYVATEYSIVASLILHIINNGIFGELIAYLQEHMPHTVYIIGMFIFLVASIIISIVLLIRNRDKIKDYIKENRSVPHAYAALKNRWFVAYAACMIYLTCSTIARV